MAQVYYGVNRGKNSESATVATSTQGNDVEIRVNTGNVLTREEFLEAILQLKNSIIQNVYPFA